MFLKCNGSGYNGDFYSNMTTRKYENLRIPTHQTSHSDRPITYHNKLPNDINKTQSFLRFKLLLKNFLGTHQFYNHEYMSAGVSP